MAILKDLIVNGPMRVIGTIYGSMNGKITIGNQTYDGSANVTIPAASISRNGNSVTVGVGYNPTSTTTTGATTSLSKSGGKVTCGTGWITASTSTVSASDLGLGTYTPSSTYFTTSSASAINTAAQVTANKYSASTYYVKKGTLGSKDGAVSASGASLSTSDTSGISVTGSGKGTVTTAGWINTGDATASSQTKYITAITVPASKTLGSVTLNSGTSSNRTYLTNLTVNGYTTVSSVSLSGIINTLTINGDAYISTLNLSQAAAHINNLSGPGSATIPASKTLGKITNSGTVTTLAGTGTITTLSGSQTVSKLSGTAAITANSSTTGNLTATAYVGTASKTLSIASNGQFVNYRDYSHDKTGNYATQIGVSNSYTKDKMWIYFPYGYWPQYSTTGQSYVYIPDSLTGNVTAANVLAGKTFLSPSGGATNGLSTGTMTNRGAVTSTITSQNGTYTIPAGYHNGSGVIKATIGNGGVTVTNSTLSFSSTKGATSSKSEISGTNVGLSTATNGDAGIAISAQSTATQAASSVTVTINKATATRTAGYISAGTSSASAAGSSSTSVSSGTATSSDNKYISQITIPANKTWGSSITPAVSLNSNSGIYLIDNVSGKKWLIKADSSASNALIMYTV